MSWQRRELADEISKVAEDTVLWHTEIGLVRISSNGLAIAVRFGDQRKGFIFHGRGGLILDTIVETNEGAVGRSIEREINEPFLMLGDSEEIERRLTAASNEDLEKSHVVITTCASPLMPIFAISSGGSESVIRDRRRGITC